MSSEARAFLYESAETVCRYISVLAQKKCHLPWEIVVVRGVGCNILVLDAPHRHRLLPEAAVKCSRLTAVLRRCACRSTWA